MRRLRLLRIAATLASTYVGRNGLPLTDIPTLMERIYAALTGLPAAPSVVATDAMPTEAEIARSVQPNRIVSFLDGKSYKTLKHHLLAHGLTPEEYRRRFGLPDDYPTVAPSYASPRSHRAKPK